MSNVRYLKGRKATAKGLVDWEGGDLRLLPVNTDAGLGTAYVLSQSHEFLSDVAAGTRLDAATALAGKTVNASAQFAFTTPVAFTGIVSGKKVGAWILYKHTGTEGTSYLLAYLDTGFKMPRSANGNTVNFNLQTTYLCLVG